MGDSLNDRAHAFACYELCAWIGPLFDFPGRVKCADGVWRAWLPWQVGPVHPCARAFHVLAGIYWRAWIRTH